MVGSVFAIPRETNGVTSLAEAPRDETQAPPLRPYIVGPENHLLSQAVASVTSQWGRFNPLFISGASGLGETHLLECLVVSARQASPKLGSLVISGADYARGVSDAIDVDSIDELRDRHRTLDLFVIDGLHEFDGKATAQQEVVNTIDRLVEINSMVIVTSRSPLDELNKMAPMLLSRLSSGLSIPLAAPDPKTCGVILQYLAKRHAVTVPPSMLEQLTQTGTLRSNRWSVADLTATVLELRDSSSHSKSLDRFNYQAGHRQPAKPKDINKAVARHFNLTLRELTSNSRRQKVVRGRALSAYLIRTICASPFVEIGRHLGGRDHTTMLHAVRRANALLETDPEFQLAAAQLRSILE